MADVLLYDVKDGVAIMTLNRPERRNAINGELGQAINKAFVRAASDKGVRALIITGAGASFCAGGDAEYLGNSVVGGRAAQSASPDEPDPELLDAVPEAPPHMRSRYTFAGAMPIPTYAAINGPAVGAGLVLTMSCDFRFGCPNASFSAPFTRIGMTAEMGLAWTIAQTVGIGRARDMLLSGRRIDAEEALRWGLMTKLYPAGSLIDECFAFAKEMAQRCSPRSIRSIKKALDAVPTQTFAQAFETARLDARAAIRSADFREGIAALREKRPPNWPAH
jgi:enoyl-CoA hydratase/carnithine racemase